MVEDVLRSIRHSYFRLPPLLRNVIGVGYRTLPRRLTLGKSYAKYVELLVRSRSWSVDQLADYQLRRLQETVSIAYQTIPYYRKRFDEYGIHPENIKSLEDIQQFPLLTKQEVKDHLREMTSTAIPSWKWLKTTTGGSTASPMIFYQLKGVTRSKERAFFAEQWSRFGYRSGARTVQLRGRSVGQPEKGIFWEYEAIQNFLEMDSNYLSEKYLPAFIEAIVKFKPQFIIGYVSSVFLLARYLNENPHPHFPQLKAVLLASENLYPEQRELLERVFKCPLCSHYGHSEMVLLGGECEQNSNYHFFPEYGYMELLKDDGTVVTTPGERGELVGTSFDNPVMPFIRYRTEDYAVLAEPGCACGRNYPMIERVEGRLQEYIVTGDGRLISICVMGAAHFDMLQNVHQTQYYQDTPGELVFRVIPKAGFSEEDRQAIIYAIQEKIGSTTSVVVETVEDLPRTAAGKHRMMIQKLDVGVPCDFDQ